MGRLNDIAIMFSDRSGVASMAHGGSEGKLTTILYHHFRFGDEEWAVSRDRLKRQCDFLATDYDPVSMKQALGVVEGTRLDGGKLLMVTIDDSKKEIAEVIDVFEDFEIPLSQFVCAGWSEVADDEYAEDAVAVQLVSRLHFYDGEVRRVTLMGDEFVLDNDGNVELIDAIIALDEAGEQDVLLEALGDVFSAPAPRDDVGGWREVRAQSDRGVTIGCHSVSHPKIGLQSPIRQRFEIKASQALIEKRIGRCSVFAYPYGTPESHTMETKSLIAEEGFDAAFTTQPALACPGSDALTLPRIAFPDEPMSDAVFRARVRGGGIPLRQMKDGVRNMRNAARGR